MNDTEKAQLDRKSMPNVFAIIVGDYHVAVRSLNRAKARVRRLESQVKKYHTALNELGYVGDDDDTVSEESETPGQ